MAFEADKVVVTLLADNAQFDAATKSSAASFSKSMGDIQKSGSAAEGAVGQFSSALKENRLGLNQSRIGMQEFQHIARGMSDQLAASGVSTQLFTSHIGELSEAIVLSGGSFGKLGAFLQGPWGIALTLATTAVAGLVGAHFSAKDAADQHRTAEETLTAYVNGEKVATDALVDSLKKLNDEEGKSLETTNQAIRARYDLAQATLAQAQANRAVLQTQLANLQSQQAQNNQDIATGGAGTRAGSLAPFGRQSVLTQQIAQAQLQLTQTDAAIGQATALIDTELTKLARNLSTNVGRVTDDFDKQVAALEAKYRGTETKRGGQTVLVGGLFNQPGITEAKRQQLEQQLIQQEEALGVSREKAIAAARKLDEAQQGQAKSADHAAKSTGEYGRQIGFADAEAIARKAGLTVTSGYRSEAQQAALYNNPNVRRPGNPVARPGTSAHEGVNGKWALDIAFAPGLTPQSLKKIYGDQGVSLTAIYKEAGHYHIEGRQAGGAATAARAPLGSTADPQHQEDVFQSEMARLNGEFLAARKSQVKDTLAQLDFQEDEVKAEQERQDALYQASADSHRITQAQADQLKAVNATVAVEKLRALETQKQIEIIQRQDDAAERTAQYRQDDIKAAEEAATSQAQRRELDLQILDILYQEKLAHLERLKLIADENGDLKAQADLQAQIDQLPAQRAADRHQTDAGTMDPLETWLHSVPQHAQAVTEALQGIATNGFDQIASSIAGVVTGTQTLAQAFSSIAQQIIGDIVQMTVKMLIFRAISSVLGGGFDQASFADTVFRNDVSIANTSIAPNLGSVDLNIPSFAGGGFGVIGGMGGSDANLLSMNGQPVAWVSKGEGLAITPSNASAASSWSAPVGPTYLTVHVDARDAVLTETVRGWVAQGVVIATQAGAATARNNLANRQMHQLGSRG